MKDVFSTLLLLRERRRMFRGEKLEDSRFNKPIPLSLQWTRRKGRRKEGLPQLLSVMPTREADVKMGVRDMPHAVAVRKTRHLPDSG